MWSLEVLNPETKECLRSYDSIWDIKEVFVKIEEVLKEHEISRTITKSMLERLTAPSTKSSPVIIELSSWIKLTKGYARKKKLEDGSVSIEKINVDLKNMSIRKRGRPRKSTISTVLEETVST
jgi:hypothetical protein